MQRAASEADIVVHTADSADNETAANAIAKGLAEGHSKDNPGFWIHVSGTGVLLWHDTQGKRFGEASTAEQTYHDINDIDRILTLPDFADHRPVDKIAIAANSDAVKVMILCPPTIYGTGAGLFNRRSIQVPNMARSCLLRGYAPVVEAGKSMADNMHIDDFGQLFVLAVGASRDPLKVANPEIFGPHGYFFSEHASHRWADVAKWVAEAAYRQGYVEEPRTLVVTQAEVEAIEGVSTHSYGKNSKGVGQRARALLGWKPKGVALRETVEETVASEAKLLGLKPKSSPN